MAVTLTNTIGECTDEVLSFGQLKQGVLYKVINENDEIEHETIYVKSLANTLIFFETDRIGNFSIFQIESHGYNADKFIKAPEGTTVLLT